MFIKNIKLVNFRNYNELNLGFENKKIILCGDNGEGKSNFIESIYFLSLAKAIKASKNVDLIKWNTNEASISAIVSNDNREIDIDFKISKPGRIFLKVDGVYKKRLSDFLGTLSTVLFDNNGLEIIKGKSLERRKYIDNILIQISPQHYNNLQIYNKALKQRNIILKKFQNKTSRNIEELEIWEQKLIEVGSSICFKRLELINKLIKYIYQSHLFLTGEENLLEVNYVSKNLDNTNLSQIEIKENYFKLFEQYRDTEIKTGHTIIGPHRDDLNILFKGKEAKHFASQGQQRIIAFAFKFGEYKLIEQETQTKPIFLLDDVLSELDLSKQKQLLNSINELEQVFITTTHIPESFFYLLENSTFLKLKNGKMYELNL